MYSSNSNKVVWPRQVINRGVLSSCCPHRRSQSHGRWWWLFRVRMSSPCYYPSTFLTIQNVHQIEHFYRFLVSRFSFCCCYTVVLFHYIQLYPMMTRSSKEERNIGQRMINSIYGNYYLYFSLFIHSKGYMADCAKWVIEWVDEERVVKWSKDYLIIIILNEMVQLNMQTKDYSSSTVYSLYLIEITTLT